MQIIAIIENTRFSFRMMFDDDDDDSNNINKQTESDKGKPKNLTIERREIYVELTLK